MRLHRRSLLRSLPLAVGPFHAASAQPVLPSGPITLIVPTAAAGTTDFAARLLAEPLSQRLRQPVVVENRAGANGALGTGYVARARPDGATLLVQYSGYHVGTPAVVPNLGYDVKRDFAPIALLMDSPQVIFAHPSVPARTLRELIDHAKANPGRLNYASSGNGSMQHLGTELLKQRAGIDLVHVPYRGTGPATQDLLARRVQLFMTTPPPLMPYVRDGSLRALAITAAERHPALPDVPTLAESGLPDFTIVAWFAAFAPAGTQEPVRELLAREMNAVVSTPDFRRKAEDQGAVVRIQSPAELSARVERELDEWTRVVRASDIQAD